MNARILSQVVSRTMSIAALATFSFASLNNAGAQNGTDYDPATGIVYQKVIKTVERPVVETKIHETPQTVYRPQKVTESRPESRTVYSPVVQYKWEPRLRGRWNPFRPPTVQYHHVPTTSWEARNEVVHRTNTRTEWVAETRKVQVPQRIVRMEREQRVEYVPVRTLDNGQAVPQSATSSLASRLRPLNSAATAAPVGQLAGGANGFVAPRIAASTVGRMTSDPPSRSTGQGGMRATELTPTSNFRGQPLPPANTGIADLAPLPFFR